MCRAPGSNTSSGRRKGRLSKTRESIQIAGSDPGQWAETKDHTPGSLVEHLCAFLECLTALSQFWKFPAWKYIQSRDIKTDPRSWIFSRAVLMKIALVKEKSSLLIRKSLTHPWIVQCSLFCSFLYSKSKTIFLRKISTHSLYVKVWSECSRKYKNWPLKLSKQLVWVFKYYWNRWKTGARLWSAQLGDRNLPVTWKDRKASGQKVTNYKSTNSLPNNFTPKSLSCRDTCPCVNCYKPRVFLVSGFCNYKNY